MRIKKGKISQQQIAMYFFAGMVYRSCTECDTFSLIISFNCIFLTKFKITSVKRLLKNSSNIKSFIPLVINSYKTSLIPVVLIEH